MIYLDTNATTPLDTEVLEAMVPYLAECYGNASSVHAQGRLARRAVEEAREEVAALVGAREADEIVFTSGGTESDTTAMLGAARLRGSGRVLLSAVEHPAVSQAAESLAAQGFVVERVPVEPTGWLDPARVAERLDDSVALVSVMAANNEYGGLLPVAAIAALCRERGILFHTDAVQAVGKVPFDLAGVGADLASLSAHKIYGPKGVGALYIRKGLQLPPLLPGGGQEKRRRAGTENVAGIVGFGRAARLARGRRDAEAPGIATLRDRLERRVLAEIPEVRVWAREGPRLPNTSAVSFRGASGEAVLIHLDLEGVAVSVGSACSSGTLAPSPAILALGADRAAARGTVRFSLCRHTRPEEIDRVAALLPRVVAEARVAVGAARARG